MNDSDKLFQVSDFEQVLCQEPLPLLVGGQAVNLWAMVYARESEVLAELEPFLSHDCDLYGDTDTLLDLARRTQWKMTVSSPGQASPVVGFISGRDTQGRELTVEVLTRSKD